jgi:hypothetical protein
MSRFAPALQRKPTSAALPGSTLRAMENEAVRTASQIGATPTAGRASHAVELTQSAVHGLDPDSRSFFEPRFGCSFADVRLHSDDAAARSAAQLEARAYTMGRDIWFGAGQHRPDTLEGQRLIAHELTHVVQQRRLAAGVLPPVQREPDKTESEAPKEKTLADQSISTADPAAASSAGVIDGVLKRSQRLAPYIGQRLKGGYSIAEKGRFVLHTSDGNFENAYRKTYSMSTGDPVPKHITGFFDPAKSVVHLRPGASFGTAFHEAMHRTASGQLNSGIAKAAQAISQDLLENILEGTTAYMVDLVLADEGLPNFNDAYRDEKKAIVGLVAALDKAGHNGFDLVARMYFYGDLQKIGAALGVSEQEYSKLNIKGKAFETVLRKINTLM